MPWRIQRLIPILTFLALLSAAARAGAADFAVNTTVDLAADGRRCLPGLPGAPTPTCSLRAAIQEASRTPEDDRITLPAGTYGLTIRGTDEDDGQTGDLDVFGGVVILGAGVPAGYCVSGRSPLTPPDLPLPGGCSAVPEGSGEWTLIDGGEMDRVFHVHTGRLEIRDLAIAHGTAHSRGFVDPDRLAAGGGILNLGRLTLINVAISRNRACCGGGIFNGGDLSLSNVSVAFNDSTGGG